MAKKYQVKTSFLDKKPDAVTLVKRESGFVAVALGGKDITVQVGASKSGPPVTRTVKGATQSDLKYLFEIEKHPFVEEVDDAGVTKS